MIRFQCDYAEGAHPLILRRKWRRQTKNRQLGMEMILIASAQERRSVRCVMRQRRMFIFWWEEPRRILQSFVRFFARIKEQLRPIQVISMCMRRER